MGRGWGSLGSGGAGGGVGGGGGGSGGGGVGGSTLYIYSIYIWSGPGPEFGSQIRGPVLLDSRQTLKVDKTIDREVLLTSSKV